jgi:branched-chain amino acid transport system ATP-binding protein
VIGPNGAGKTTLFHMLGGSLRPDRGRVVFEGKDVTSVPAHGRCRLGIARTYQVPRPFSNMTVLENLLVGAVYGGGSNGRKAREKCGQVLEQTGLAQKKDVLGGSLPLLDRKRLELAKALCTSPRLLLLDEVAGGLTESEVEDVVGMIHAIRKDGVTVLWVEHIMMAMTRGPDRLVAMNFGKNLLVGTPAEVLNAPEVQEVYLGTVAH